MATFPSARNLCTATTLLYRMAQPEFEHPDLLPEYLQSLQDQLDGLRSKNSRLSARIEKLEAEQDRLRDLLPRRKRPDAAQPKPGPDRSIVVPALGTIPDLPLPEGPVARPDLNVACVLDEFSDAAFRYEFSLLRLTQHAWMDQIEETTPNLLLVESAYRGVDGSWAGRLARFGRPDEEVVKLTSRCKELGVTSVFWNKEDPINHDWFAATASLFDVILTVDSNLLSTYERKHDDARAGVMQFGAQPLIHHPGDDAERVDRVAFAGSYYAAKHPERREQMEWLLGPALEVGLDIFDRMDRPNDPRFSWPAAFRESIVGSLTYAQTLEVYRRYGVFLNVNTVVNSPTMCARRIYELLASGSKVVSGPSAALAEVPVTVVEGPEQAKEAFADAFDSGPNVMGMDWVANGNTMSDRVEALIEIAL